MINDTIDFGAGRINTSCSKVTGGDNYANLTAKGFFEDEMMPIEALQADGSTLKVDKDKAIRSGATYEGVEGLKPAFVEDGVITAGNSSPLNAGAIPTLQLWDQIIRRI